ncbi:hypothetical protein ACLKA7_015208 [Drosophila subpalustris]
MAAIGYISLNGIHVHRILQPVSHWLQMDFGLCILNDISGFLTGDHCVSRLECVVGRRFSIATKPPPSATPGQYTRPARSHAWHLELIRQQHLTQHMPHPPNCIDWVSAHMLDPINLSLATLAVAVAAVAQSPNYAPQSICHFGKVANGSSPARTHVEKFLLASFGLCCALCH